MTIGIKRGYDGGHDLCGKSLYPSAVRFCIIFFQKYFRTTFAKVLIGVA